MRAMRLVRRHTWWAEVAVVLAFYLAYASTRALAPGTEAAAAANARRVLAVERWAHLHPEAWLNHLLAPTGWLAALAGYYYLTLHFLVTVLALVFLYLRRPDLYARMRTSLTLASVSALFAFWFLPVAPPRLAESGIDDVVVQHNTFGAANAQSGGSPLENVYAAMPSLHVGWALWVALAVVRSWPSRWTALAWLYPVATTVVVLSTGNHYLLDAVAGAALVLVVDVLTGRWLAGYDVVPSVVKSFGTRSARVRTRAAASARASAAGGNASWGRATTMRPAACAARSPLDESSMAAVSSAGTPSLRTAS
jgi:PAP2 superfamily